MVTSEQKIKAKITEKVDQKIKSVFYEKSAVNLGLLWPLGSSDHSF